MKTRATLEVKKEAPASDVRWERVAQLKAAIEAGTYTVSSGALAERLMEHMLAPGCRVSWERDL